MKLAAILTVMATTSFADTPVIQKVATTAMNAGGWRFDVTVSHPRYRLGSLRRRMGHCR